MRAPPRVVNAGKEIGVPVTLGMEIGFPKVSTPVVSSISLNGGPGSGP